LKPERRRNVGIRNRIERLEDAANGAGGEPLERPMSPESAASYRQACEDFWCMELEFTALHLLRGCELRFTLDGTDRFTTLDGRFAVSRSHTDLRGIMGPRSDAIEESIPPERWPRFLEADTEAAELLERLLELAECSAVPDDFKLPTGNEWTQEEVDDFEGTLKPSALFVDAEEREATRRLTWTLANNPDARVLLSELTRRRDVFVVAEGGMPEGLPPSYH
jgi:hypothetical protein